MNSIFKIIIPIVTGTSCLAINGSVYAQVTAYTVIDENFIQEQGSVDDHKYDITTIDYDQYSNSWAGLNYPRVLLFGNRKSTTMGKTYLFSQAQSNNIGLVANGKLGLVVNNQGQVGIGTYSPAYALDVKGRSRFSTGGNGGAGFFLSNNGTTDRAFLGMLSDDYVGIWGSTAGWNLVMNVDNGNVGIGNSSPNAPLQFSNAVVNRKIVFWDNTNDDHQYFGFGLNSGVLRYQVANTSSSHLFYAGTSASASKLLMSITGTGKVGIGTDNPETRLHVKTGDNSTAAIFDGSNAADNTAVVKIRREDFPGRNIEFYPSNYDGINTWQEIKFNYAGTVGIRSARFVGGDKYTFDGNVGIGTNVPAFALDVKGRGRFASGSDGSAGFWLTKSDATSNRVFVGMANDNHVGIYSNSYFRFVMNADNGNIGLNGVAEPHAPLQFSNSGANRKLVLWETVNNDHQYYGLGVNSSTLRYQVDGPSAAHVFYAGTDANSSKELLRIKGNGYVGIGTATPTSTLDIQGALTTRNGTAATEFTGGQIYFGWNNTANYQHAIKTRHNGGQDATNAMDFYVWDWGTDAQSAPPTKRVMTLDGLGSGSVGIGTATPQYKLHLVTQSSRTSIGNAISINGSPSFTSQEMPIMETTLGITNTASGTFETYSADFGVNVVGTGNNNFTTPFMEIQTNRADMPIVMEINDKPTMQIFQNQVLIGPNLPHPIVGAVAPYSGMQYTLGVRGRIVSSGLTCKDLSQWADYVFDDNYELKPLDEVSDYISENKHLPDVPSAKEVIEKGIDVSDMLKIQMQKIEELTLYTIEQQKQLKEQQKQIDQLIQAANRSAIK